MSSIYAAWDGESDVWSGDVVDTWQAVTRLMQQLHDGPAQLLALALLQLDRALADEAAMPLPASLRQARVLVGDALRGIRGVLDDESSSCASGTSPGITAAWSTSLANLAYRFSALTGQPIRLDCDALVPAPPPPVAMAVLHAAKELLSNACKHAPTAGIELALRSMPGGFELAVRDDGPGFDPLILCNRDDVAQGRGLAAIPERLAAIGATLQLQSRPGSGVHACIRWSGYGGAPGLEYAALQYTAPFLGAA